MLLALNYSPQAAELVQAGLIDIDRFKCPPWPDMLAVASELRPVAIHFELRIGRNALAGADWDAVKRFCDQYQTPYVNVHLAPRPEEFPHIPAASTAEEHLHEVTETLLDDLYCVTRQFGPERVIVENVPYREHGNIMRAAVEPEVVGQVIRSSGCGLLLDISHARIAAAHTGRDERAYIEQLPVDRIRELHITGMGVDDRGVLRDHLAMRDEDWPTVDWVLERFARGEWPQPWLAAFEYGGIGPIFVWRSERSVIATDVPRLRERIPA